VDTLFHLPEAYLYLVLIDFFEQSGARADSRKIYQDVRAMIDEAHADGSIKDVIRNDPGRFVTPDPRLPEFLDTLRGAGKKVFLLTNSEMYYTDVLLSHLLQRNGRPWRTYFDLVAVDARKPRFFREHSEMTRTESDGPGAPVISGGDVWKLERELGLAGDSILYWGDHTYGDILRSKKSVGWRTAMIIPEVEQEIAVNDSIATDLLRLDQAIQARDHTGHDLQRANAEQQRLETLLERSQGSADEVRRQLAGKISDLRNRCSGLADERAAQHQQVVQLEESCSRKHNRYWGMVFREANDLSRFGHQVKDFACIYTSRVSNFLSYPMDTYFRAAIERMPHEL
jgi:FMN phosphatase YigB (HAD superfamily)